MTSVKTNKKGFTLVELVVVIAILAILAAIAIPVVNSIINTASKNGALSNAQTIELAVKEAQADIAAKNTEVYDGTTSKQTAAGGSITLPSAKTSHSTMTIFHVAVAKGIEDAFDRVTYNGNDYYPYWDQDAGKCVFIATISGTKKTIEGENAPTNVVQLGTGTATATSKYGVSETVTIESLAAPSSAPSST